MQQKGADEKSGSPRQMETTPSSKGEAQGRPNVDERSEKGAETRPQKDRQSQSEDKSRNGSQQRTGAESKSSSDQKDRSKSSADGRGDGERRGSAQTETEPRSKSKDSTATEGTKEPTRKGAESGSRQNEKSTGARDGSKDTAKDRTTEPSQKGAESSTPPDSKNGARVQVSAEQRANIQQTLLKDNNVNRVTNVNVSINVGTRMPRSVRLAPLPTTIVSIAPAYRSYQYFVVDDRICIVEPSTYEIVDVIEVSSGQTAARGSIQHLVLTDDERAILLNEIAFSKDSTLGLDAFREGAEVPSSVHIRAFPERVVERVPKVKNYKYFTAENRIAIVDSDAKITLVISEK